nr:hypothetical protein GCM10020241_41560 [Streptoalloteichus tenebrarius]
MLLATVAVAGPGGDRAQRGGGRSAVPAVRPGDGGRSDPLRDGGGPTVRLHVDPAARREIAWSEPADESLLVVDRDGNRVPVLPARKAALREVVDVAYQDLLDANPKIVCASLNLLGSVADPEALLVRLRLLRRKNLDSGVSGEIENWIKTLGSAVGKAWGALTRPRGKAGLALRPRYLQTAVGTATQ